MSDPDLVGSKLGNYRLQRLLGRGRMGVVYLAQDEALLRPTAVKILSWAMPEQPGQDPEAWFLSEARHVARINHPNVVHIYGVAKHGPHCYIAMEYIEGGPADARIEAFGPFAPDRATEILVQAAAALQAAHDAGVVHRDVKPGNLLIGVDGSAKLGDFGMALDMASSRALGQVRAGTPFYTAPEIWVGMPATPATDIYALGATYFYLLTGNPPFQAPDLPTLITAHLHADVSDMLASVANLPSGCRELLQRCLAKSPDARIDSAQSVGWQARGLLRTLTGLSRTSVPPAGSAETSPAMRAGLDSAEERCRRFFGFTTRPFSEVDPLSAPYTDAPFDVLRAGIRDALQDSHGRAVVLEGASGSGRSILARQVASDYAPGGPVAVVGDEEPGRTLLQRVCIALGGVASILAGSASGIDELLGQLHGQAAIPLLVLDCAKPSRGWLEDAVLLVRAAAASKCFRVMLLADSELAQQLARIEHRGRDLVLAEFAILPLGPRQTQLYMKACIRAALGPNAAKVVITPDAAFLAAHRSGGRLRALNQIAFSMLCFAAIEGRRVLTSWDAWNGHLGTGDERDEIPRPRPTLWPTPEVLQILNSSRLESGIVLRRAADFAFGT